MFDSADASTAQSTLEQVSCHVRDRLLSVNLFLTLMCASSSYSVRKRKKKKYRCMPMCLKGTATVVTCCFVCMVCDHPSAGVQFPLYLMHFGITGKLGKQRRA